MSVSVFGQPMSFWEQMPVGMLLRSPYVASSIGEPTGPLSLDAFAESVSTAILHPVPLERFVEYGRWFQRQALPDLDPRHVSCVELRDRVFRLILEDGSDMVARRLVVAAGIGCFPHVPPVFRGLPAEQVSHTAAHRDLSLFRGRRVLVVGAGQSALESAALLAESGAEVQIAARAPSVRWLGRHPGLRRLGPVSSLLYAPAEVGPPFACHLVEAPKLVRQLPAVRRVQLDRRSIRPAGASWLRKRVIGSIPLALGHEVETVDCGQGGGLTVGFQNGCGTAVDHVLLGTGYRVELSRYPFLSPELLSRVEQVDGYPVLGRGFESSVPGLHFLGAPAAWTFGPLMRFVAGTRFTVAELSRVLHQSTHPERDKRVAAAA